jgi:hypothetical protein
LFFFIYIYKINDTDPALIICRAALILQRDLEAGNFTLLMLKRAAQIKVAQVNPAFIYFRSISGSFTSGPKRFVSRKINNPPKIMKTALNRIFGDPLWLSGSMVRKLIKLKVPGFAAQQGKT